MLGTRDSTSNKIQMRWDSEPKLNQYGRKKSDHLEVRKTTKTTKKKCLQTRVTLRQCGFLCRQRQLNQTQSVHCGTLLPSDQVHDNEEQNAKWKTLSHHVLAKRFWGCFVLFLEFNCQGTEISARWSENCKIPSTTECGLLRQKTTVTKIPIELF